MTIYFKFKKNLDHFPLDVECAFEKGVLAVHGNSGSGKTTLLNCIAGLTSPDEGRLVIHDQVIYDSHDKIDLPAKSRNIGYVFQHYALFPNMSVYENLIYGIKNLSDYEDHKKRKELLDYAEYIMDTFQIQHLKHKYPKNVSGGEKQRVALARAIVRKPKLLLLDEPFSALDDDTKEIVYKEFATYKETFKIPTLLITHNKLESQMFSDQVATMSEGSLNQSKIYSEIL